MTYTNKKKRSNDAKEEFFLYIAFHSALTALANLFKDD
jgi:hypothetical protein